MEKIKISPKKENKSNRYSIDFDNNNEMNPYKNNLSNIIEEDNKSKNNYNYSKVGSGSGYGLSNKFNNNMESIDMNYTKYKTIDLDPKRLEAKLETKKLRLKELKKQYDKILEENSNMKVRLGELEKFKRSVSERIENFDKERQDNENFYYLREKEILENLRNMEEEVKSKHLNILYK
jgi:hypothetical protein